MLFTWQLIAPPFSPAKLVCTVDDFRSKELNSLYTDPPSAEQEFPSSVDEDMFADEKNIYKTPPLYLAKLFMMVQLDIDIADPSTKLNPPPLYVAILQYIS